MNSGDTNSGEVRYAVPDDLWGEWLMTAAGWPVATVVVLVEGGAVAAVVCAGILGAFLVGFRLLLRRLAPQRVTMSQREQAKMARMLKLAAAVAVGGYLAVIVIAIADRVTWLPIWPGVALGLLCGVQSVTQLVQATARARHGSDVGA
jgi:hypothetical protein